jgi:hypothetical protein
MRAAITRTLFAFAALAAALLVALAVATLRALDRRGVTLAGGLLDAMGAARRPRTSSTRPFCDAAASNCRRSVAVIFGHLANDGDGDGTCSRERLAEARRGLPRVVSTELLALHTSGASPGGTHR